jgi:hypothetical protein
MIKSKKKAGRKDNTLLNLELLPIIPIPFLGDWFSRRPLVGQATMPALTH